jgi:TonB family protein
VRPERKILTICFIVSVVLHVMGGMYTQRPILHRIMEPRIDFHEISLAEEDENRPKQDDRRIPPKVKKMMEQQKPKPQLDLSKMMTTEKIDIGKSARPSLPNKVDNNISLVATAQPIHEDQFSAPSIDLEQAQQILETSASIDITDLEPTLAGAGVDEIINVSPGGGKSTAEILNEGPVVPVINIEGDGSGDGDLIGSSSNRIITGGPSNGVITLDKDMGVSIQEPELDIGADREALAVAPVSSASSDRPQVEIGGDIANRPIVHKRLPNYPAWALKQGLSGTAKLQFWVTPDGHVRTEKVIVLQTTGYSNLDDVAINALKSWKFAPLAANVRQEDQSGTLVIRFVLM